MKKLLVLTLLFCFPSISFSSAMEIESIKQVPLREVKEVKYRGGYYLMASEEEPIGKGASKLRLQSLAERRASLRARGMLAAYLHGEKFKRKITSKSNTKMVGDNIEFTATDTTEEVAYIDNASLSEVEVFFIDRSLSDRVRITVGIDMSKIKIIKK